MIPSCNLCPRRCGARREAERGDGFCKMGTLPVVARAALHFWEEPCISGTRGSGTVFFTGCTLQCVFCQNYKISAERAVGKILTPKALSDVFFRLVEQGAQNINLVSGAQFVPAIAEALAICPLPVPVVYNSGGYESMETLHLLDGLVQIYLPDYKYDDPTLAARLSGAADYVDVARPAILEMARQTGPCVFAEDGALQRGTIVRHLLLPGHTRNTIAALDWLKANLPDGVLVSLMGQYTPCGRALQIPGMNRKLTPREYARVRAHMRAIGLEGYCQALTAADGAFIPAFDGTGVDRA